MSRENSWKFLREEKRRRQAAHNLPKQRSIGKKVAGYVDNVLKTKLTLLGVCSASRPASATHVGYDVHDWRCASSAHTSRTVEARSSVSS